MPKPKPPLVFSGRVREGVLHLDKRALFTAALKAWDGRVTVTVAPEVSKRRRERANRYYHGASCCKGELMDPEEIRPHGRRKLHELMNSCGTCRPALSIPSRARNGATARATAVGLSY